MADDNDSRIDKRKQELEEGDEDSNLTTYVAIVGIVAVIGIVGFVFMQGGSSPEEGVQGNVTAGQGQDPTMVSSTTSLQDNAVTVYYFGDFKCPHCASFEENYMPRIRSNYVETGEVRFVFKPVDFLGEGSYRAAMGAQCVWNQSPDAYWDWHTKVFSEQRGGNWPTVANLVQYSRDVEGVDAEAVRSCLESEEYAGAVQRHRREASEMGAQATPNLVINGTVVNGNNYEEVQSLIEAELEN